MSLKDPATKIVAMEAVSQNTDNTDDAFKYGFASDVELRNAGDKEDGYSIVFEVQPQHVGKLALFCFTVCILSYSCNRLFGKIKPGRHNGVLSFWNVMMYGEIASCTACFTIIVASVLLEDRKEFSIICADMSYDLNMFSAYGCLLLWIAFIVAILRAVTSITWLHRITDVERLTDIGRGIGILTFTLLFLIPLAVLGRQFLPFKTTDRILTLCLPVWTYTITTNPVKLITTISYIFGGLSAQMSTCRGGDSRHNSALACPLVVLIHFAPVFFFSSWCCEFLQQQGFPEMFPAIYCITTAVNSLCNLLCYKLYVLTSQNDQPAEDIQKKDCVLLGTSECEDLKIRIKASVLESPPEYKEKQQSL